MAERPPVIDADGHVLERQSDIRKYLQPPWDQRASGSTRAVLPGDNPWDAGLFSTLGEDNPEYQPVPGVAFVEGMSPDEQIDAWHRIMDREGIETAVCFPTRAGTAARLRERDFQVAVVRACNDMFAREFNAKSDRVRCVGVLPMAYPDAAVKEMRRAVEELGIISFEITTTAYHRALGDPFFDPIYAEAERLGVPLCVHGTRFWSHEYAADRLATFGEVHCYAFTASMLLHFTSMICQGVPVRFPKLRLAFLEVGATWLPFYLDRLDEHWEKRGEVEMPSLSQKPSQIVRDSKVYISIEAGESLLPQTIEYLGDDHFLYASDVPHWDNEFPHSLRHLWERQDLSPTTKEKLLYSNSQTLFGLKSRTPAVARAR